MFEFFRVLVGFVIIGGTLLELSLARAESKRISPVLIGAGLVLGIAWFIATSTLSDPAGGLCEALAVAAIALLSVYVYERLRARSRRNVLG